MLETLPPPTYFKVLLFSGKRLLQSLRRNGFNVGD